MDERDFQNAKTGKLFWETNGLYYRFEPNRLPLPFQSSLAIGDHVFRTALVLGRLDGLTQKLSFDEIELLRLPFILKEAQLSSEIEGTRSTLTDVYKGEKQRETNEQKALDNQEIQNYATALEYGLKNLAGGITEELIKKMHFILLQGVRGENKEPGSYKTSQNAIGSRQDTLETAKFVPASAQTTPLLMKNFVEFVNTNTMNPLQKAAIAHYQFEAIHPFMDGNGRVGRLLIVLILCKEKLLAQPLLYISEFFNRNRSTYTDLLYAVSAKNAIEEWIAFFLKALQVQSEHSLKLVRALDDYKQELQAKMTTISRSPNMYKIINLLFKNPFITITDVAKESGLTLPGASMLVRRMAKAGVVKEISGKKARKIFVAYKILDIVDGNARTGY